MRAPQVADLNASGMSRSSGERIVACAIVTALTANFLWCAFTTLDYGLHSDESRTIDAVRATLRTGTLLPGWYNYPSLIYLVSVATAIGYVANAFGVAEIEATVRTMSAVGSDGVENLQNQIDAVLAGHGFQQALRGVFAALTATCGFMFLFAARAAGASWISSSFAAAIALTSFQVFYHSRWVGADGLVLVATAVAVGAALRALRRDDEVSDKQDVFCWAHVSAAAAGVATSAKYTAGVLMLLPLIVVWRASRPGRFRLSVAVLGVFAGVYLLITPGTIVDPVRFVRHALFEISRYKQFGAGGAYSVEAGSEFLIRILDFVTFRISSQSSTVSVFVIAAALFGAFYAIVKDRLAAWVLLPVPLAYTLYLASNQTLYVRNLLIVLPFIGVLAALGVDVVSRHPRVPLGRTVIPALSLAILGFGLPYLAAARSSFEESTAPTWPSAIAAYIEARPRTTFVLSKELNALTSNKHTQLAGSPSDAPPESVYLYMLHEHQDRYVDPALRSIVNRRNIYEIVTGPRDIDLDYYPSGYGVKRVVAVNMETAKVLNERPAQSR